MTIIDTLIFDRTAADTAKLQALEAAAMTRTLTDEELAEWNAAVMRGAYNAEDLNRIGAAVVFADAYLSGVQDAIDAYRASLGVADEDIFDAHILPPEEIIVPRQDWSRVESPLMADDIALTMRAAQVTAARIGVALAQVDISRMTYADANAVERAIHDAYRCAEDAEKTRKDKAGRIAKGWYFSGDLVCGEYI